MARDQCSQVDKRQLIVRVFLTLQAEAFMVAPKEQRPGEPSEEALMSLSKREWEHMLWTLHMSLRSLAEEFGRPDQQMCDVRDAVLAGPPH